ncbi:MAG: spinster family MFS transporter [Alphaproteobacteria bacterium]
MTRPENTQAWPSTARAWTVTSLLLLAYVLSFIDRQILNLLAEPIRLDLELSDLEIGFVQGPAFVVTYILISFPLGWLSDSVNRMRLLAVGLGFWTLATMACGLSRDVTQLAIARAGVGVGEATLTPTAWSLLADSFPPEKRSVPVSIFLTGPYLGAGLAMLFGAQILTAFSGPVSIGDFVLQPWQICFIVVAAPGLILAAVIGALREPKRMLTVAEDPEERSLMDFLRVIAGRWQIYVGLWGGAGFLAVMLYGLQAWTPAYLMRVHGFSIAEAGVQYGVVALFAGSAGVLSGPFIHRWLMRVTDNDHALTIGAFCAGILAPLGLLLAVAEGLTIIPIIAVLSFAVTIPFALITTTLQLVTPNVFRGRAAAVSVVASNLFGLGFGPPFVGYLTDSVFRDPTLIGNSMGVLFIVFGTASAICFFIGARSLVRAELHTVIN